MTDYQVLKQITCGNVGVELLSNGTFFYLLHRQRIQWAHSDAATVDGRRISTKTGERREVSVQPQTDGLRKGAGRSACHQCAGPARTRIYAC